MRADRARPPLVWAGSVAPVTVRVCKEPRTGADRTTDRSRSSIATCPSVDLAPPFVCTTKETIPRYKPLRCAKRIIAARSSSALRIAKRLQDRFCRRQLHRPLALWWIFLDAEVFGVQLRDFCHLLIC